MNPTRHAGFRLRAAVLTVARLAVLGSGVVALTATGAPYDYTFADDGGRVSELAPSRSELSFRVVVCGEKPYTGGGLLNDSARSEIRVFVDDSDSTIRFDLRRKDVSDSKTLQPNHKTKKVFERQIHPTYVSDGVYCDFETELVLSNVQLESTSTVSWHVEAHYLNVMDGSNAGPPSIKVEAQP